jgi:acetyltransferase-like isoleucine patch superfamily enzyme
VSTRSGLRGSLPSGVVVGDGTRITGDQAFRRFYGRHPDALVTGRDCLLDGVQFAIGVDGRVVIGDNCYFTNAVLLAESEVRFGSRVVIGWNATIADTDFHPLPPELRWADAEACSPLGDGLQRPEIGARPVVVEDDVWIGPNAALMKGVHIGAGAFIEPGSVVTSDVPARSRVMGNPARVIGGV